MREHLMSEVDELIQRQSRVQPVQGLETFQVETAARRVLRELVDTFFKSQTEADAKIKRLEDQQFNSKRQVQEVHSTLRRIQTSLSEALLFGRRMNVAE